MSARRIETDALVVGSGGIGATYARLMKPHVGRVTMIDSGAQLSRIPGEHVSNPYVYQHQPNLSLGMMYGQNQLFSIPEEPYRLEIPRGELFNPPVMRRNFTNPLQNPNANMMNAADANLVGGAFALWSCFAPTPVPWELQRFGQPQITFDYRIDADDAARADLMMEDMTMVADAVGDYIPIETSAESAKGVTEPFFQPPGTSWHWMGTYRMGPEDDGTCVVDPDSRVWGFDNLYLGGGGVIPNEVATNCTLMASAIAAKSVSRITGRSIEDLANDVGVGSD